MTVPYPRTAGRATRMEIRDWGVRCASRSAKKKGHGQGATDDHAGRHVVPGLSTICVASAQLDCTGSLDSDVPAIVAGAVMKDCAAVLMSGRLASLPDGGIAISALSGSRSRDGDSCRAVNREVVASDGAETDTFEAVVRKSWDDAGRMGDNIGCPNV